MKLLWLTDLHLDGPSMSVREALYKSMERQRPKIVVITGDIAASGRPESELESLASRFPAAEIYFVLGNHDFFGSSFVETDRRMAELCRKHGNLHHLVGDTVVPLGDDMALIGHRGWGDARTDGEPRLGWPIRIFGRSRIFASCRKPKGSKNSINWALNPPLRSASCSPTP